MLSMQTGIAEFAVSPEEMEEFTKAAGNVARHYNVETTQKTLDWIALVGVSAHVFGTRAVAIMVRTRKDRKSGERRRPAEVRHLRPVTDPPGEGLMINPDFHTDVEQQ
jgi:hypothetical protein